MPYPTSNKNYRHMGMPDTTNARRLDPRLVALVGQLKQLMRDEQRQAFKIGDLVNRLVQDHKLMVKTVAGMIGVSRQRLGELKQTAAAFPAKDRRDGVDIHYFTIAARSARRLGIPPTKALGKILENQIQSTRKATQFLAREIRARDNAVAVRGAALRVARDGGLINRCHHDDYRNVVSRLADGSVKLVVADGPYGTYARRPGGRHTASASTRRHCDALGDDEARQVMIDLLRLTAPKMTKGGCLIIFRPGACADPAWLTTAIEEHGWTCERALTWNKRKTQLGRGDEPYGISTERLLVLCRQGDSLVNHDGSDRSEVLDFRPVRPNYMNGQQHHQFEKPISLCRFLVSKHTFQGELVVEPFGGSGPVSAAANELGRHWVYAESDLENFSLGSQRVAASRTRSLVAG